MLSSIASASSWFPRAGEAIDLAAQDPDEAVRGTAEAFLERTGSVLTVAEMTALDVAALLTESAATGARELFGDGPWTPTDVALLERLLDGIRAL